MLFRSKNRKIDNPTKLGFLAQDLQKVLNEVVKSKTTIDEHDPNAPLVDTEYLGVMYSDIIPVVVKAIQEQQDIIEDMKNQMKELETLKQDYAEQKKLIETLKAENTAQSETQKSMIEVLNQLNAKVDQLSTSSIEAQQVVKK